MHWEECNLKFPSAETKRIEIILYITFGNHEVSRDRRKERIIFKSKPHTMFSLNVNKKGKEKRFDNEFLWRKEKRELELNQSRFSLLAFSIHIATTANDPLISLVLYCSSARSQNIIAFNVFFSYFSLQIIKKRSRWNDRERAKKCR